jgi:hypothetical protein
LSGAFLGGLGVATFGCALGRSASHKIGDSFEPTHRHINSQGKGIDFAIDDAVW